MLVHVDFAEESSKEDLSELSLLVSSAGVNAVSVLTTSRSAPHTKYFVGSGKAEEIAASVNANDADVVIFNHALSPSQERNLETIIARTDQSDIAPSGKSTEAARTGSACAKTC